MVEPTFEVPFLLSSVENALENDAELKLEETLIGAAPGGYFADRGFACAVQVLASPAALDVYPRRGALFEAAVVAELRTQAALLSPRPNLWHWRLHSGAEMDLLQDDDTVPQR